MSTLAVTALRAVCLAYLIVVPPQGGNVRGAGQAENDVIEIMDGEIAEEEAAIIGAKTKSNRSDILAIEALANAAWKGPGAGKGRSAVDSRFVSENNNFNPLLAGFNERDGQRHFVPSTVNRTVNRTGEDKRWINNNKWIEHTHTTPGGAPDCSQGRCEACYFLSKIVVPRGINRSVESQSTQGKVVFRGTSKKTPFSYDPISVPMGYSDDADMLGKIPMKSMQEKFKSSIKDRFPRLFTGNVVNILNGFKSLEFYAGTVATGGPDGDLQCQYVKPIPERATTLAQAVTYSEGWLKAFENRSNIDTFERTYYPEEPKGKDLILPDGKMDVAVNGTEEGRTDGTWTLLSEDQEGRRQADVNKVITFPPLDEHGVTQPAILMKITTTSPLEREKDN